MPGLLVRTTASSGRSKADQKKRGKKKKGYSMTYSLILREDESPPRGTKQTKKAAPPSTK